VTLSLAAARNKALYQWLSISFLQLITQGKRLPSVVEVSDKTGRKKESEKHENMKKNEQFCVGAIERKREMVVEGMKCDRSINACFLFDFFWGGLRRR
jgi:hypothetical protein